MALADGCPPPAKPVPGADQLREGAVGQNVAAVAQPVLAHSCSRELHRDCSCAQPRRRSSSAAGRVSCTEEHGGARRSVRACVCLGVGVRGGPAAVASAHFEVVRDEPGRRGHARERKELVHIVGQHQQVVPPCQHHEALAAG